MPPSLVGVVGGMLGGLAMNQFARLVGAVTRRQEAAGAAPGLQRYGRGMQPPQAIGRAEQDAAVHVGSLVYRLVERRPPGARERLRLGTAAHYAFSAALGVLYTHVVKRMPAVRRGYGTFYGALVWAAADEGAMPALGLSRGPRQMGFGLHAYSLIGHGIYGATLELARRRLGRLA